MDNIHAIIPIYMNNLFVCDFMFYIDLRNEDAYLVDEKAVKRGLMNLTKDDFSFTKTIQTWNESNTVKYRGISLGEFQLHINRKCFKFRFDFKGLQELDLL